MDRFSVSAPGDRIQRGGGSITVSQYGAPTLTPAPGQNVNVAGPLAATGPITASNLALGGKLTTDYPVTVSGAFSLTVSLTGLSSVTLPTAGTLATLAGNEAFTNKSYAGSALNLTGAATVGGTLAANGPGPHSFAGNVQLTDTTITASPFYRSIADGAVAYLRAYGSAYTTSAYRNYGSVEATGAGVLIRAADAGGVVKILTNGATEAARFDASQVATFAGLVASNGGFKWADASLVQTTVGAAGGASALPATPLGYAKIVTNLGVTGVVPFYAAA